MVLGNQQSNSLLRLIRPARIIVAQYLSSDEWIRITADHSAARAHVVRVRCDVPTIHWLDINGAISLSKSALGGLP